MSQIAPFLFIMPIIRCRNSKKLHNDSFNKTDDMGKLLFVLEGNYIYAKCSGNKSNCKRWTRLEINFPGIKKIDFKDAALIQTVMPSHFTFPTEGKHIKQAPILIED